MDAQGTQAFAQEDTRFLAIGTLTTDLSQYQANLTADIGGGYETNSTRAALARFDVYVSLDVDALDTNRVLVAHADASAANATFEIYLDGARKLVLASGSPTIALWTSSAAVPSAKTLDVWWSCRANPDTTGAADASISEVLLVVGGAVFELDQFTHADPSPSGTWTLSVGGVWDGANLSAQPTNPPNAVRIGNAPHSHAEDVEEWVAQRDPHVTSLADPAEPIGGAEAGDQGDWAGAPNVGWAAAMSDAMRGKMLSPISIVYRDPRTLTSTPTPQQWAAFAPGSGYVLDATRLLWVPADGWRWAEVRVHVKSWVTAGTAVPVGVRVYAFNRPHLGLGLVLGGEPIPPLQAEFVGTVLTVNHGALGVGEWLDLGLLRLPALAEPIEGWANTITIGVAHIFDPDNVSANDANARLKLAAVQLLPLLGDPQ